MAENSDWAFSSASSYHSSNTPVEIISSLDMIDSQSGFKIMLIKLSRSLVSDNTLFK